MTQFTLIILLLLAFDSLSLGPSQPSGCQWRHNLNGWIKLHFFNLKENLDTETLPASKLEILENCLYYYLAQLQPNTFELINEPPLEFPLVIKIEHYQVHQVDLFQKSSSQFNIHGELYLTWNDTRLEWNETEWKIKEFALHDNHHVIFLVEFLSFLRTKKLISCCIKFIDLDSNIQRRQSLWCRRWLYFQNKWRRDKQRRTSFSKAELSISSFLWNRLLQVSLFQS